MSRKASGATSWDEFAADYHDRVLSPFSPSVRFPLKSDVRRLLQEWRDSGTLDQRVVFDCGSGIGEGLQRVAGQVGLAAGLDLSLPMLQESEKRLRAKRIASRRLDSTRSLKALCRATSRGNPPACRTLLVQHDISALAALRELADLVLAVNSIAPETSREAADMFSSVAGTLSADGIFMGVFPSLDTLEHLESLTTRRGGSMKGLGSIDRSEGVFVNVYGEKQKCYTPEELQRFCDGQQMKIERLEKVRYPWSAARKHEWGYFPGSPCLWDWYLLARRFGSTTCVNP